MILCWRRTIVIGICPNRDIDISFFIKYTVDACVALSLSLSLFLCVWRVCCCQCTVDIVVWDQASHIRTRQISFYWDRQKINPSWHQCCQWNGREWKVCRCFRYLSLNFRSGARFPNYLGTRYESRPTPFPSSLSAFDYFFCFVRSDFFFPSNYCDSVIFSCAAVFILWSNINSIGK